MSAARCDAPLAPTTLLGYWLRELDDAEAERIEAHVLGCEECSATLESLIDLAGEIRACVQAGLVPTVVTDIFVWRLAARGVRLREYRVPCNGSVHCTIAPEDEVAVARLEVPLAGIREVDVVLLDVEGEGEQVLHDVPFDAAAGEILVLPRIDRLRALPASTARMRVVAVEPTGARVLGEYTFIHHPWGQSS